MADLLDMLIKDVEKMRQGGKYGNVKVTIEGRRKMRALVEVSRKVAYQITQKTAEEIAALAVDLMTTGINEGAIKVLAGGGGGLEKGVFAMEEGADDFEYSLSNSEVKLRTKKMKFNPKDSGRFGKFGEQFLFGAEAEKGEESKFPDLMKLAEKYGEAVKILAPEIKAYAGDAIDVGGQVTPQSTITHINDIIEKYEKEVTDVFTPKSFRREVDPVTFRSKKIIIPASRTTKMQSFEKISSEWKLEVDSFVMRAVGVVKLLQKVSTLMVLDTNDLGVVDGKRHFEFEAATIFARLDVDKVIKGLNIKTNIKRPSFNVNVKKEVAGIAESYNTSTRTFTGGGGSVEVSIKNPASKKADGSFSMGDYRDHYSLWEDKKSRDLFFTNMYQYLKDNDMFADAKRASAQEEFNMERAIKRMRKFQGKT